MDGKIKAILIALLVVISTRGYSQSCNITSRANNIEPDKLCAPVSVIWDVVYRGVDDGGTGNVQMRYDWDDGSPIEIINATLIDAATGEWETSNNHIYPIGGDQCNYHPRVTLVVDGIECTSSVQEQTVTVWDTDDMNGGEMNINPVEYPICVGNGGTANFVDNSQWNCTPPDEEDVPNDRKRWVQWVYGTNSGAGNFIDDALVDGTLRAYPFEAPVEETTEPILGPTPPISEAMPIQVNDQRAVGDEFEIELRNWNYCNPYPTHDPVITRARIVIVDNPDATITQPAPLCENDAPIFLTAATGGGVWTGNGIVDASTGEFDPSMAGEGIHLIEYTVFSAAGCVGTDDVLVEVKPTPSAAITPSSPASACPGIIIELDGNPSGGTTPYTHIWTGDIAYLSNTAIPNPVFQANTEGIFNLNYRVTSPNGCFDEDAIQIITDTISIKFTNNDFVACTGISFNIDPMPTGGSEVFVEHLWTGTNTALLSATNIQNPDFTGLTPGTYTYTYTVTDSYGCSDFTTVTIVVHQQPVSNAGDNTIVCGMATQLAAVPSIGVGTWTLISGTGSVTFSDVNSPTSDINVDTYGEYTFQWSEDNNSCISSDQVTFTFAKVPTPIAMENADTCGLVYQIKVTPDVGLGQWTLLTGPGTVTFEDASADITGVTVTTPGNYSFRWTENNNGCIGSTDTQVDFFPIPVAQIQPFDNEQCSPADVQFENISTNANSYDWDFGDGATSEDENPLHAFTNFTFDIIDYEISLIAKNDFGCADTSIYDISVLPNARANFANSDNPGCSPLEITFTNQSEGASSYEWHFGDGSPSETGENPNHTFFNNEQYVQAYHVELIANNNYSCSDTADTYITVYPKYDYTISASPTEGCHPLRVDLLTEPGAMWYKWDFGDGNITDGANAMMNVFENTESTPKTIEVQVYTSSAFGCLDTSKTSITVNPSPVSSFTPDVTEGCSPLLVEFENNSVNVQSSRWLFGDGDTENGGGNASASHTYTNTTTSINYWLPKLIVENSYGCKDSSEVSLSVFPQVKAAITDGGAGCTPYFESIQNNTEGANSYFWDFGDGNTSDSFNGHHTYINNTTSNQTYEVSMIATSMFACSDTAYTQVTAYRRPIPEYTVTPQELQMPESTVNINNLTTGSNLEYLWRFGDGNTSSAQQPGNYTYNASGEYEIWLRADAEYCSDSLMQRVLIHPNLPILDYGPDSEGCPPLEVQFYNNSIDAHTYFWDFGDGNVSSEKAPKHTYYTPGQYNVTLLIEGPGGIVESNDVVIHVYDKPFANFEVRPTVVKIPETVSFINKSEGAINYLWDFGDGNTSTEHSIQYAYQDPGSYDVTLIAINDKGCKDSLTIRNAVTAKEAGRIDFPNSFTPNPNGSNGGVYVPGSPENHVFYPFVTEGVVEYEFRVYSRWGEILFESTDINIGWDGYFRGKLCPGGVYIWKVYCRYSNGLTETLTGDVTLFR
ncbi:PKD domain-containing protein [Carboxylicivirga sediminis]|uniref:PKD domain-containing protein n=1 Tax=Carboxylicivirga sediminis TaxID=2006564 RepID=A0A941IY56_9BACT|nr:PKD domain-containing protein [Carboxylicivirga sediminis]MBR8537541.1 PKD domain-containing protein [Carboxylicivirga sediminis]